jgi:mono/diheme cytochrome c family protein
MMLVLALPMAPDIAAKNKPVIGPTGRDIYMDRCSACHGEDGRGQGPAVAALKIASGDLTLLSKKNGGIFPVERVKNIVGEWVAITAHGSRETPIWGAIFHPKRVSDQQAASERLKDLVAFCNPFSNESRPWSRATHAAGASTSSGSAA